MSDLQPGQPASTGANREENQPSPSPLGSVPEVMASIDALLAELEASQQAYAQQLQQAEQARDDQAAKVKGLEGELAKLTGERDATYKEKATAQQNAAEIKQQLAAQAETLLQTQQARDDQAAKVKGLEGELAKLTGERDATYKEKAKAKQIVAELTDTQRQLTEARKELDQLRIQEKAISEQSNSLKADLSSTQQQLTEAREEAKLILLQLHLVQEELERYFLLSESQKNQQERHKKLLRSYERLVSSVVARS